MKKSFLILATLLISISQQKVSAQTNIYDTIIHSTLSRTFLVHIPASYNPANTTPLVIGLHGGGSPSWNIFEQASQLIAKSDASGFILVYPEGVKFLGLRTWNGGGCCGYASTNNIDDVGFIDALLDTLNSQYNIDTNRVYATGFSNGAIMTYRLACELSHRIAAIAPVSGTLEDMGFVCNTTRAVPIIQFHSTLDSNIYLQGGFGTGSSGHEFNSVNYGLDKFAITNNCFSIPDSNYFIAGSSFYYKKNWNNCNCNAEQILYVTGDGGHSWPGGVLAGGPDADPPSTIINANDSIWNFFLSHTLLNCGVSSVNNFQDVVSPIEIYPNPSNGIVNIKLANHHLQSVKIYNASGAFINEYFSSEFSISNLPNGMYFVITQTDRMTSYSKLIKH